LPEVGRWQEEYAHQLTLSLISRSEVEENETKAQEHSLKNVLPQKDWEISSSCEVGGPPSAVLIGPEGKVGSPVARGIHRSGWNRNSANFAFHDFYEAELPLYGILRSSDAGSCIAPALVEDLAVLLRLVLR
jgi:hypothetical protein